MTTAGECAVQPCGCADPVGADLCVRPRGSVSFWVELAFASLRGERATGEACLSTGRRRSLVTATWTTGHVQRAPTFATTPSTSTGRHEARPYPRGGQTQRGGTLRCRLSANTQLERETGFEPATACLEGRNSTAELLPLAPAIIAASQRGSWPSASPRTHPSPPRGRSGSSSARSTGSQARGRCPASGHSRCWSQSSAS